MSSPSPMLWASISVREQQLKMLPTIPNLPTDNLYKFIALAGLLIAFVGYGFQHLDEERWYAQTKVMEVELDALSSSSKELVKLTEEQTLPNDELSKEYENFQKSLFEFQKKFAPMNSPGSQKLYQWAGIAGYVGIILSIVGFVLWYQKVQKPLDEILKIQLEKARESEVKNNEDHQNNTTVVDKLDNINLS